MIFIPEADIHFSLIMTDIQFTVLAVIRFEHEISWKNAQFLSERFLKVPSHRADTGNKC